MDENPCYYSVIPATIRYDSDLSSSEKIFYSEITALSNKKGYCFASNSYFAKLYDVSPSTISSWISHLKEAGHLDVDYIFQGREIKKRIIKPIFFAKKQDKRGSQKTGGGVVRKPEGGSQKTGGGVVRKPEGGYSEKTKDNITSINNTSINNIYTERILQNLISVPIPAGLNQEVVDLYQIFLHQQKEKGKIITTFAQQAQLSSFLAMNDPVLVLKYSIKNDYNSISEGYLKKEKRGENLKEGDISQFYDNGQRKTKGDIQIEMLKDTPF